MVMGGRRGGKVRVDREGKGTRLLPGGTALGVLVLRAFQGEI